MKQTLLTGTTAMLFLLFSFGAFAISELTPSRKINVHGTQIAIYESAGKAGPGILLIHGNTSSANAYAKFMKTEFARQNRVVALDLPGYGQSGNKLLYNAGVFRNAIVEIARQTKVDEGVIVGWSWGGDLALQAMTELPKAKGVFIFGTSPFGGAPESSPSPLLRPNESYAGLATTYGVLPLLTPGMVRSYVKAFFAPNYSPIPTFLNTDGYRTASGTRTAVAVVGLGIDFTHQPEVPIAQNLKVPLAMVYSTQDAFVRYEYLKSLESSFPTLWTRQTVVVPGYGHALQWEAPEVFADLLRGFISEL